MINALESLRFSPTRVAETILTRTQQEEPPFDLSRVFTARPDLRVVEDAIDGDGYFLPLGRMGAEIVVNERAREQRKRFTIAHELGHWLLSQIQLKRDGSVNQPARVGATRVEEWCDRFAVELLMPERWIRSYFGTRDGIPFVKAAMTGHEVFNVSKHAFRRRVAELFNVDIAESIDRAHRDRFRYCLTRATEPLAEQIVSNPTLQQLLRTKPEFETSLSLQHFCLQVAAAGPRSSEPATFLVWKFVSKT